MGKRRLIGIGLAALTAVLLANGAEAANLRSWDQKLAPGQRFLLPAAFDGEAVLDKETQLLWQRAPFIGPASWRDAAYYCANTNVAGRMGWRLPEAHELMSLVDTSAPVLTVQLPQGHPFQDVQIVPYWTATEYYPETARFVDMLTGAASAAVKEQADIHVWCVRGYAGE